MAGDDIVQKITITTEGADAAATAYKSVADAADNAAQQIQKAGEGGGEGLAKAGEAAATAAEQLGKLGEAAAGIGDALSKVGEAGGNAADGLGEIGNASGGAASGINQLGEASASAASSIAVFVEAIKKVGDASTQTANSTHAAAGGFKSFIEVLADAAKIAEAVSFLPKTVEVLEQLGPLATRAATALGLIGPAATAAAAATTATATAATATGTAMAGMATAATAASAATTATATAMAGEATAATAAAASTTAASTAIAETGVVATAATVGVTGFGAALAAIGASVGAAVASVAAFGTATTGVTAGTAALTSFGAAAAAGETKLALLGSVATSVFGAIAAAAAFVGAALLQIGAAIATALAPFAALIGVAGAIVGIGVAGVAAAESVTATTRALTELAEASGLTVTQLQQGEAGFHALGLSAETFDTVAKNIGETLSKQGDQINTAFAKAGEGITTATTAAIDAEKKVLDAQIAINDAAGRSSPISQQRIELLNQEIASLQKTQSAWDTLASAQQSAADAQKAQAIAVANDLRTIVDLLQQAAAGAKDIKFDDATTAATKFQALVKVLNDAKAAGQDMGQTLVNLLKNLSSQADAFALGKKFGLSDVDVNTIRQYGDAFGVAAQKARELADVPIGETQTAAVKAWDQAVLNLQSSLQVLGESLKSSIFADAIVAIGTAFINLGTLAVQGLTKITDALGTASNAISNFASGDFAKNLVSGLASVVGAIANVIPGVNSLKLGFELLGNISFSGIATALSVIPAAVDETLNQVKSVWFAAWAAMADAVGSLFQKIPGLGAVGDQLKAMAAEWRQTSQQAAQAAAADAAAIGEAWQDNATKADQASEKIQAAGQAASKAFVITAPPDVLSKFSAQADELFQKFNEGKITAEQLAEQLKQIGTITAKPVVDISGVTKAKEATGEAAKAWNDAVKAFDVSPTTNWDNFIQGSKKAIDDVKKDVDSVKDDKATVAPPDTQSFLDKIKSTVEQAKTILAKTFDMSASAAELEKLPPEAEKVGQEVNDALKIKPEIQDPSGAEGFSNLVQAAEKAANEIEAVFANIKPEFSGSLNFDSVIDAARSAVNEIEAVFQNIRPEFSGSIDFNAIVNAAQQAAQQVAQAFSTIIIPPPNPPDFGGVIAAASAAAQQIAAIFADVLSQISTAGQQIQEAVDQATTSLQTAKTAATDAATAASAAAKSAQDAENSARDAEASAQRAQQAQSQASGNAWGGLISGPGSGTSDSILARISNGEFIIRAAAVAHYGASLFELFNNMRLPKGGFAGGGLNRLANLSFSPRIALPAFAAGGIVSARSSSAAALRPINLHLDGRSFAMTASEDVAKQLERAAIRQQVTATGIRPRWNR